MKLERRDFLKASTAGLAAFTAGAWPWVRSAHAANTVTFADVGVSDPDGNWSKFTKATGWDVNLVAMGNAPSQVLNTLIAGGGTGV